MRTDIAIDKLCDICPIIADISDKAKNDIELRGILVSGQTAGKAAILRLIPKLKAKCEQELYEILAILYDKTVDEIKAQSAIDTLKQVMSLAEDKDFISFFSLFSGKATTPDELSPQSDNTDEEA